jgi:hypothetical protein
MNISYPNRNYTFYTEKSIEGTPALHMASRLGYRLARARLTAC